MSRKGLEFLGAIAGGLVHEIKNPLSTLRINLTLLKEDIQSVLPDERRLTSRVEVLEKEVQRLDAILADFMRYAGMRSLERRTHDLAVLVGELAEFVGPGFQLDGIRLELDVPPLEVEVDGQQIKQALLNVLLNAQQALQKGGRVRVRARRTGGRVELEVEDDGCGVGPDELERIFDVYYSGFKTGSGLGLPTARRILEEHGGGMALESEAGKGTRASIWFPS
jgi:signal transduction histidine kinase